MNSNSFLDFILRDITQTVDIFLSKISEKYNLDKDELQKIWSGDQSTTSLSKPTRNTSDNEHPYNKLSKQELVSKCKDKGLKVSGSKIELIERLEKHTEVKTISLEEKPKSLIKHMDTTKPPVLQKLTTASPLLLIKRNSFGNYEHQETSIVFDNATKKAIGIQNKNGQIDPLTKESIEQCHKYNFSYTIPDNLVSKDDVKEENNEAEEEYEEIEEEYEEVEEEYEEIEEEVEEVEEEYED